MAKKVTLTDIQNALTPDYIRVSQIISTCHVSVQSLKNVEEISILLLITVLIQNITAFTKNFQSSFLYF